MILTFSILEPIKTRFFKIVSDDNMSAENLDIRQILKRSLKGKLVIAYFDKNKKLSHDMRQKLTDSLIENILMDDLNKKLNAPDLAKLAECIAEMFPPENKETYFSVVKGKANQPRGKLSSKYYNIRRQFRKVYLIPSINKPSVSLRLSQKEDEDTENMTLFHDY